MLFATVSEQICNNLAETGWVRKDHPSLEKRREGFVLPVNDTRSKRRADRNVEPVKSRREHDIAIPLAGEVLRHHVPRCSPATTISILVTIGGLQFSHGHISFAIGQERGTTAVGVAASRLFYPSHA
jgi:hypothetical protein